MRRDSVFYRKYLLQIVSFYKTRQDVKMFLEILLSLFTVGIFGVFAIRPTIITIAGLTTEISSKEEIAAKLDEKIQNISVAQEKAEELKSQIELLSDSVPPNPQPVEYIRQIEGLALSESVSVETISIKDVGVVGVEPTVISIEPGTTEEEVRDALPSDANEVQLIFGVSGEYSSLVAFLKKIESHRRPISIDSITFGSSVTEQGEKTILNIEGRLPYLYAKPKTS